MSTTLTPTEEIMTQDTSVPWMAAAPVSPLSQEMPGWYRQHQLEAWETFLRTPDPVRKDEAWRFADLKKVRFTELVPAPEVEDPAPLVSLALAERPARFAAHFIFANNRLVHHETGPDHADGLSCLTLEEALAQRPEQVRLFLTEKKTRLGGDKFAALHHSATLSGVLVEAGRGTAGGGPVIIDHFFSGQHTTSFPCSIVTAEHGATVSVLERFHSVSPADSTVSIASTDLRADQASTIHYTAVQTLNRENARHIHLCDSRAGRDSRIKSTFVHLGGKWVRNESVNRMMDAGADCQIFSANLMGGTQELDQRTLQLHDAQHTTSNLLFKNALYQKARAIFSGLIQVLPGAHHTDSYQTCRNLLESEDAEANAMPGLEIDADQVKCSHGSTSGQMDEEEIFYLRSRGITPAQARQMISLGFLNEALQAVEGEELKEILLACVERKFAEVTGG